MSDPKDTAEPIEALLARRTDAFKRKLARQTPSDGEEVHVPVRGPIGIYIGGDPHLDNDGCDINSLLEDLDTVAETEGMYGISLGDMTDNWIGRLADLYASNEGTADDGWRLLELYGQRLKGKWLLWMLGNHDAWGRRGPIVDLIGKQSGVQRIRYEDAKLRLTGPGWSAPVRVHVRHSFPGRSVWNVTHGVQKAAQLGGWPADVLTAGHTHTHGYARIERPNGTLAHCVQVGSYKRADDYGVALNLPENRYGQAAVIIIDPDAPEDARITVHLNVKHAARMLRLLRAARG
jgi:hypothetical protein